MMGQSLDLEFVKKKILSTDDAGLLKELSLGEDGFQDGVYALYRKEATKRGLLKRGKLTAAAAEVARGYEKGPVIYFAVPHFKLVLMIVFTFGLYELYYIYKNWNIIRRYQNDEVMPVLRTIFSGIFCYSLFRYIYRTAESLEIKTIAAPSVLAVGFVFITLMGRLPDPYWIIAIFAFVPLLAVNKAAIDVNRANDKSYVLNPILSASNLVVIVIGVIWWLLVFAGLFL